MKTELTWSLKIIPVSQLKEWEGNPRKISKEDIDELKKSFQEFGHARTLTVCPEGDLYIIIGGNQSKKALTELKYKEIQCSVASRELTEQEKKKLSVFLNHRSKGEGEWDFEMLKDWEFDFNDLGIEFGPEEKETSEKKEKMDLVPYKKTHILLSFNPEKILELKPFLDKILEIDGIEYEQSSN
jgi:hypothetical protein